MKLKIKQIKIKDRFRKDAGDIESLKKSIEAVGGLLHPVVIQKGTNRLIAGWRRIEACKQLGWTEIPVTILDMEEIAQAEFHENMVRKNFTLSEAVEIIEYTKKWLASEFGKESLGSDAEKRVRENAAKFMGISHGQLWKMQQINKAAKENPEKYAHILDDVENGQSVNYAHKSLKNTIRMDTITPDLPDEEFELIEMDPPWKYDLDLIASPPYRTMTLEEMKEEIPKLPAYKDCIMFMWATNPKLDEAIDLMNFYGFKYKTNIAWVKWKNNKLQTNVGYYVKGSHELLLIGTRGSPGVPPEGLRAPSVIFAERGVHSKKPQVFYDLIQTYYPKKKKISMFARTPRDGWTTWGDEQNTTKD